MTNHEAGFRPSNLPALDQCIHFEPTHSDSEAVNDGRAFHVAIAIYLKDRFIDHNCPIAPEPNMIWAIQLIEDMVADGWEVVAVEFELEIYDEIGQLVTTGTVDVVLRIPNEPIYRIIDWKTGEWRDYGPQFDAYMMAACDHFATMNIDIGIAYTELEEMHFYAPNYFDAASKTLGLYSAWSIRNMENPPAHKENPYCSWCAVKGTCPVWREQAAPALAVVNAGVSASMPAFQIEELKNNPQRLGDFLRSYEILSDLVEKTWKLKEALRTHIETGTNVNGWGIVNVKESSTMEPDMEAIRAHYQALQHIDYPHKEKIKKGYSYLKRKAKK